MSARKTVKAAGAALILALGIVCPMEGRSLISYLDPVGIPTICDGDTAGVKIGQVATPQECDARTAAKVEDAIGIVDRAAGYPLPDPVRAALGSFVYNVGTGKKGVKSGFLVLIDGQQPTILRMLKAGNIAGACNELLHWTYAGGRQLGGLVRRRQAERDLCMEGL